jgi:hypothetical protein
VTIFRFRPSVAASIAALTILGAVPHAAGAADTAGYVVIDTLSESYEQSGNLVIMSGVISNQCTASLPKGSAFVFEFDGVAFTGFNLRALKNGDQQAFSVYGSLPLNLPAPKDNKTSLGFTIRLPKDELRAEPDDARMTSPCLVTFASGTPSMR